MRLVDAHHHLWDLGAVRYPWLEARGVRRFFGDPTSIQRNYGVGDLRADAAPHEIVGSVHVQVGCAPGEELAETAWLEACASRTGLPSAIVAAVDLTAPDVEVRLDSQQRYPRVRGVRQIVGREPEDDRRTGCGRVLEDPAFARGLSALAERGLSFDLQLTVQQMPRAAALLSGIRDLRVAVCHVGSPWDRSAGELERWREGLDRLAALPHAICKLSGLSMFDPHWTQAGFVATVGAALDAFQPERCAFGSNFPVDGLHRRYGDIVDATHAAVAARGSAAVAAVFEGCARRFYRL